VVMFSPDDTIVALATPPGRGGLAVVRLSGPRAPSITSSLIERSAALEPRRATLVRVKGSGGPPGRLGAGIDEAVVTFFPAPGSYTGEDLVEFSLHGSPVIAAEVIGSAVGAGARLAGPGEFTLRAFLNGRLDLTRAEAVQDLVEATTPQQARMAFDQLQGTLAERLAEIEALLFDLAARLEASADFPEEGYHFISPEETLASIRAVLTRMEALLADSRRGRLLREGVTVAVTGRPNVGKSTLFNRLIGVDRAIVTAVPGTTRDLLTEAVVLGGARMTLVDTAGVGTTYDPVEREGVARAERARASADFVIVVLDSSTPLTDEDRGLIEATSSATRVIAANKSDLAAAWSADDLDGVLRGGEGQSSSPESQAAGRCGRTEPEDERVLIAVSAATGSGVDRLIRAITRKTGVSSAGEPPAISNVRQIELLGHSTEAVRRAEAGAVGGFGQIPEVVLLSDLRLASEFLQEVTGKRTTDDLLTAIFSRFCIGK
jgi:tRNA modification GTPase